MNNIGMGFCCGVRLICEHLVECLLVVKAVLWMQRHFLAMSSDLGLRWEDVNSDLPQEVATNCQSMIEVLRIDWAFHALAFLCGDSSGNMTS